MLTIPGNIPIRIHPFFWILAVVIGWLNTMTVLGTSIWTGIIFVSVLIHEFGHALTAKFFGQKASIDLVAMGGLTQREGVKLRLWQDFIVVLNGPIAGFLLCFASYIAYRSLGVNQSHTILAYVLLVTYTVNLFWTILNLVPVQPLDGGKLLSIVLESFLGLKGVKIALFISMTVSALIGIGFFMISAFFAGAIFLLLTFESYRSWKSSLNVREQDQNFILQHLLKESENDIKNGYLDSAINKLSRLREMSKEGVIHLTATQYLADLLAQKGENRKAYELLSPISNKLSPESLRLLHQLAYLSGEWQAAIALGNQSFQSLPNYETAVINAICYSVLGEVRPAIGWLRCAIREGLPNVSEILKKREFDNIRTDPLFQSLKEEGNN